MMVNLSVMNLPNCAEISQNTLRITVTSGELKRLGSVHSDPVDFKSQSLLVVFFSVKVKFLPRTISVGEKDLSTVILDSFTELWTSACKQ